MERLQIAREVTGKPRNRLFVYQEYLDILNRDDADGVEDEARFPLRR